jgi:tetraacyldisaccharide 4'-kinase
VSLESQLTRLWYGHSPLRWLLWPATGVYRALVALDRTMARWRPAPALVTPIIIVGNVTVGGAGKTPTVIWLVEQFSRAGLTVGVISRGYGGRATGTRLVTDSDDPAQVGDEPLLIRRRTGCSVAIGRDRIKAAQLLLEHGPIDVIVSDDGLQHWRLKGDYELAVVDASRGLGNGLCLPAGPLRESAHRLSQVDGVLLLDGDGAAVFSFEGAWHGQFIPSHIYPLGGGDACPIETFKGRPVHAVAAIGNPQRFASSLQARGLEVTLHALSDHGDIASTDLCFDDDWPVLVTEKDAVKCPTMASNNIWVVAGTLKVERGDSLVAQIRQRITARD